MTTSLNHPESTSYGHPDPHKWSSIAIGVLFVLMLPVLGVILVMVQQPQPTPPSLIAASALVSAGDLKSPGETVYMRTCLACHGATADGVPNLGKPLRNSAYVQENDDSVLFDMIANGRLPDDPANTTGIPMPARGAQNISDDEINEVITYLRSLQDPSQPMASVEAWIIERPAAQASSYDGPGRDLFVSMCSACHGANGEGMEGLGKTFVGSEFVKATTNKGLMTMVKMGRPIWDAANTTGIDMPPKGGNPAMNDEDLAAIITYIKSLNP